MADGAPLIELRGVARAFDDGAVTALRGADLTVHEGETLAIVGPSGSGKSTLVNILSGIDEPDGGQVLWRGTPVKGRTAWRALRAGAIAIVFQDFLLLPTLTARENVEAALLGRGLGAAERLRLSREAMARVGLAHRLDALPFKLSGGERQRVAIARAVVGGPALLLADEPTGNLDRANAEAVAALLFEMARQSGAALVLVTHDPGLAARCVRRVTLVDGLLECSDGRERLTA
jgi:putative ABC transport system ATP-binding protein